MCCSHFNEINIHKQSTCELTREFKIWFQEAANYDTGFNSLVSTGGDTVVFGFL